MIIVIGVIIYNTGIAITIIRHHGVTVVSYRGRGNATTATTKL